MGGLRRVAALAALAALLPVLAGCGGDGESDGGRIAFERGDPASPNVFVMDAAGTNQQLVITNARDPALRPDGQAVAFARDRDIYVVNINGTGLTNLTNNNGLDMVASDPAYSQVGDKIAYVLTPIEEEGEPDQVPTIRVMDADGSDDELLVTGGDDPAFSPDGDRIVFVSGPDLFLIRTDGTEIIQITFHDFNMEARSPSFSPLGDRVAYEFSPSPSIRILMLGDRSEDVLVDSGSQPAFSPFGSRVAFARGGSIFTVNIIGSGLEQLTAGPMDTDPSWSKSL